MSITLPMEILYDILLMTSPPTIYQLCQTNALTNMICNDNQFWRIKTIRDFPLIMEVDIDLERDWRKLHYGLYTGKVRKLPIYYEGIFIKYLLIGENDPIRILLDDNTFKTIIFRQQNIDNMETYNNLRTMEKNLIINSNPISKYFCFIDICYWYDPRSILSVDFVNTSNIRIGELERAAASLHGRFQNDT